ncbi:MFS transporter [Natrialba sp. PRR66]|uniref:MFS transporter n=1 Tax=Natrialba sp. PRR66 TaxID=3098146 RepID=UPI002B1DEE91|nr:MFS transporter [Natrialba sp. PRR66]
MRLSQQPVKLYYCYKATKAVGFYRPILILYLLAQGLTYTQVALLEGLYALTTVLGEVPTGYLGDRLGRRNSLLVGTILITVALIGIGLTGTFPVLIGFYIIWSMGYNFRSGSDDAWLYDTLAERSSSMAFTTVKGRGVAAGLFVGGLGSILGGYLGQIDLSLPFFVAAAVSTLGLLALGPLPEPTRSSESQSLGAGDIFRVIGTSLSRPSLRWFIVYYFMLFVPIIEILILQVQPVTKTVLVNAGVASGTVKSLLGWLYAAFSLLAAIISYNTGVIKTRVGYRRWFFAVPLFIAGGLLSLAIIPLLALPVFVFARGIFDATHSLASGYVNNRIGSSARATIISSLALVSSLVSVPAQVASGRVADATSPLWVLVMSGGILAVGVVFILIIGRPFLEMETEHESVEMTHEAYSDIQADDISESIDEVQD